MEQRLTSGRRFSFWAFLVYNVLLVAIFVKGELDTVFYLLK